MILEAFGTNSSINTLDLSTVVFYSIGNISITKESIKILSDVLKVNKSITSINLSQIISIFMESDGYIEFNDSITSINLCNIAWYNIAHNYIDNSGIMILSEGFKINSSITHIDLSNFILYIKVIVALKKME